MAYGKIKADAIIYDDSGSDVEKSLALLGTPEGTSIKSTGESGSAKYLRVDGDGTCSWQVPTDTNTQLSTEAVQDIVGAMVTGNTETGIAVTYEDGDGTLDFVVSTPTLATEATNVTAVANNSTDETVYPTFVDGATGTQGIETDTGLTYNPSTGLLTAVGLTLSGDLTVSGSTTTINTATLNVEDKNIELGKVSSPSDTTADGGGITLKGATDKTFNWVNATDYWTSSEGIHIIEDSAANDSPDLKIESYRPSIRFKDISGSAMSGEICTDGNEIKFRVSAEVDNNTALTERATLNSSGNFAATGTVSDSKGDVRKIPSNVKSSAYTLLAADAGKAIYISSGGITVANSVFSDGDAVTIINNSGSDQTITQGSGVTIYNAADAATGNRTLAGRGMATLLFSSASAAYISGAGLS